MNKLVLMLGVTLLFLVILNVAFASHSVTICGTTYVCGVKDGICPEDFPGFGKCDVADPECGGSSPPTPPTYGGGGAPIGIITPEHTYNCTKDMEIDIFNRIKDGKIYSLDGFCLDLKVLDAKVVDNPQKGQLSIIYYKDAPNLTANESAYKAFKVEFNVEMNSTVFYFRVPGSWASGIIKRSISLYYFNGTKIETNYEGKSAGFYYYTAKVKGGNGIYYIAGIKKPTIWYIIERIDAYYAGNLTFAEVVETILDYYE